MLAVAPKCALEVLSSGLILTADWQLAEASGFNAAFASPLGSGMATEMHLTEQPIAE